MATAPDSNAPPITHTVHTHHEARHEVKVNRDAFFGMLRAAGHVPADLPSFGTAVSWDSEDGLTIEWTERTESVEER